MSSDEQPARPRVSRYRLGSRLGLGGMGEVLLAHDDQIGRDVAIKRLRSAEPTDREVKRFLREARIQGRLEHPAIPSVHELGYTPDGLPYFAMERLSGTTLQAILNAPDPQFTRQRLLRAFAEVCLAVEFAHVHGVLHRDLKPDNIMLGEFGEVYVFDWGVAKITDEDDDIFDDIVYDGLATRGVIGTPGFRAPEQANAAPDLDARTDVYSLGRVLEAIVNAHPDPPPELLALVARASDEDRSKRPATARALGEVVQGYLDGDRDLALRRKLADQHLEHAQAAFAHARDENHLRTAMRDAGRALALDPENATAAELVGRLMLEPPTEVPAQVKDALRRNRSGRAVAFGRAILATLVASALLSVGAAQLGSVSAAAAVSIGIVVMAAVAIRAATGALTPLGVYVAASGVLIAIVSHVYSPFVEGPGTTIFVLLCLAWHPSMALRRHAVTAWLALLVAVLAPLLAERLGILAHTFDPMPAGGVWLHPPGIVRGDLLAVGAAIAVSMIVTGAALLSHLTARTDTGMRQRTQLQAWALQQLVPEQTPFASHATGVAEDATHDTHPPT